MSFQIQPTPIARLNRCQLFGPGSRPEIFEKMAKSTADVVNLDLEDSVAPADKEKARLNVIQAINDIDWKNKTVSVRINSLDTPYWYRDTIDLLENCSERLDNLTIPKVGCAADVYSVDSLVSAVEKAAARSKTPLQAVVWAAAAAAAMAALSRSPPVLAEPTLEPRLQTCPQGRARM